MKRTRFAQTFLQVVACPMALSFARVAFGQTAGDVNGDGLINSTDSRLVRDHLLEKQTLAAAALSRADANGDGRVTMADVVWIRNHTSSPDEITINLPGHVPLVLVRIPPGNFQMGSPLTERSRETDEAPVHAVTINYAFHMGLYELTQKQWLAVMGRWPGAAPNAADGLGDNYPAYEISWNDSQNFLTALNAHATSTGQGPATFRLPSEAEWEYACRAGTQTRYFFGDSLSVDDYATDGLAGTLPGYRSTYMWFLFNCQGNINGAYGTKPVGTKWPNQFGLYDLHGNVWEWLQDWHHNSYTGAPTDGSAWVSPVGTQRDCRGGAWLHEAFGARSANRRAHSPQGRFNYLGLRLARNL